MSTTENLRLLASNFFKWNARKPVWACLSESGEIAYWSVGKRGACKFCAKHGPYWLIRITAP